MDSISLSLASTPLQDDNINKDPQSKISDFEEQQAKENSINVNNEEIDEEEDQLTLKEKGKLAYNNGNYQEAADLWLRGVRTCNFILSKDEIEGEKRKEFENISCSFNLNLTAAFLKLGRFTECIQCADYVLRRDPPNIKALFRKGDALLRSAEYEKSIHSFSTLLKHDPDNVVAKHLKAKAAIELKRFKQKEHHLMKKMLLNLEPDPRTLTDEQSLCYNNFIYATFQSMAKWCSSINIFSSACSFCRKLTSLRFCPVRNTTAPSLSQSFDPKLQKKHI